MLNLVISGLFGLLVALCTTWLANRKEIAALERAAKKEKVAKLESLYVDEIAMIEKVIRYAQNGKDFSELFDEMARQNARLKLSASEAVITQCGIVSDLIEAWSREHAQAQPKRMGNVGILIISSTQTPHQKNAEELYPQVMGGALKMIELMKTELESARK